MEKLLQLMGLAPSENEKELLKELGADAPQSIQVVGRGTLRMSVTDARNTDYARKFVKEETNKVLNQL